MKIIRWVLVVGVVVVLVVIGVFFSTQSRGAADQYASIGAFFLALLTAAASLVMWIRSLHRDAGPPLPERHGSTITIHGKIDVLQTGTGSSAKVRKKYNFPRKLPKLPDP